LSVHIEINLTTQQLTLLDDKQVLREYSISSAINGNGEQINSGCTPRGMHKIRIKIGHDCQVNTIFKARRPTGEIYSPELDLQFPERDWILSRIIWLTGTQSGVNRSGKVDTLKRFIYIHGCPDVFPMGEPLSHGCIRMKNDDIMELFDLVHNQMPVFIHE